MAGSNVNLVVREPSRSHKSTLFCTTRAIATRRPSGDRLGPCCVLSGSPRSPSRLPVRSIQVNRVVAAAPVRYAMPSAEARYGGATVYPDSGKIRVAGPGFDHRGWLGEPVEYWEGEQ